jgi:hypothetical protein
MSGDETQHPSTSGSIPAGWYSDPAGGAGKRWWDGSTWTGNVQEVEASPPPPTFGNYVPAELRPVAPRPAAEAGVAYTRASWWIASSPLWVVVPLVVVVAIINTLAPLAVPALILTVTAVAALALVILIRLAFADRSELISSGNDSAASPWWTLLTPLAYLIARARQVQLYATGGWATLVWWCLATILAPGLSVLATFAVYGILPV